MYIYIYGADNFLRMYCNIFPRVLICIYIYLYIYGGDTFLRMYCNSFPRVLSTNHSCTNFAVLKLGGNDKLEGLLAEEENLHSRTLEY